MATIAQLQLSHEARAGGLRIRAITETTGTVHADRRAISGHAEKLPLAVLIQGSGPPRIVAFCDTDSVPELAARISGELVETAPL